MANRAKTFFHSFKDSVLFCYDFWPCSVLFLLHTFFRPRWLVHEWGGGGGVACSLVVAAGRAINLRAELQVLLERSFSNTLVWLAKVPKFPNFDSQKR